MRYGFLLVLLWSALAALRIEAACVSSRSNAIETYGSVQLVAQNFPANSNAVQQAMNQWNASTCNTSGTAFPTFQLSGVADRVIDLVYTNGAHSTRLDSCGLFSGNRIDPSRSFSISTATMSR